MKLAIVYDWIDKSGGAERILPILREMYPTADWYTSAVDEARAPWAHVYHFHTSFLQAFPLWIRRNRLLSLFLYPFAFESFDFTGYDTVLTITSSFAKGIITRPGTKHICYLLTPTRWLWDEEVCEREDARYRLFAGIIRSIRKHLQRWDYIAASRVDEFICISKEVQDRCLRYYKRESTLIYPYFDETYWQGLISSRPLDKLRAGKPRSGPFGARTDTNYPRTETTNLPVTSSLEDEKHVTSSLEDEKHVTSSLEDEKHVTSSLSRSRTCPKIKSIGTSYFLVVSRLEIYKRIDLAIDAFQLFKKSEGAHEHTLVIVGKGSQSDVLRQKAGDDTYIVFIPEVTDRDLAQLYHKASALIMPQKEEFGYTACEAIACECPVVCFARGGQTEIVEDGVNGQYFHSQTATAIAKSLVLTSKLRYNRNSYENSHICGWSRNTFVAAFSQKIPQTI